MARIDEAILLDEPMLTMYGRRRRTSAREPHEAAAGPGVSARLDVPAGRAELSRSRPRGRRATGRRRGPWSFRSAWRLRSATAAAPRPGRRPSWRPASSSSSTTRSWACEPYLDYGVAAVREPPIARPIEAALDQLGGLVDGVLEAGKFPFVLGGEHSLTAGAIRPVRGAPS